MLVLAFAALLPLLQQSDVLQHTSKGQCTDRDGAITRCEGGVVVTYQDIRVEGDWFEFDRSTEHLTAGDRIHFTRGPTDIRGGKLSYDFKAKTGTVTDAKGQVEGFYVSADLYELQKDGRWDFTRARATSCSGDCPRWNITWQQAVVTPGKKVSGKNMVFRFFGLPVFYLPRFSVPATSRDRSSGFLIPGTSTSTTKGRSLRESFFWAINRSYDATLTGEYFSKRGPSGAVEFRGAPNDRTFIDVSTFFAIDRLHQGGYRTSIRSYTGFGDNWRGVANVDITSSFPFRQVFEEGFNVISSPIQHSTGFLTNNRERASLNVLYNRDAIFFPNETSVALRKFPSLDIQLPTNRLSRRIPVYFSLDSSFTGMARRDADINTSAFMQRVDLHPEIEIPALTTTLLRWSHRIGVRDTFYTHSLNPEFSQRALNRGMFDYTMRVGGPQIEKDFGNWRHVIESDIEYRYVAGIDRFRQTVVVDETDLLTNTNEVEYGITNRFLGAWEFLSWRVAQKLYFDPTFGGALLPGRRNTLAPLMDLTGFAFSDGMRRRFSPVVSTFRISTTPQTSTDIEVDYDTQRHEFRSAGIMGGLGRGQLNSSIGYFFNKRSEIQSANNQLRGLITYGSSLKRGVSAGFGFYYDIYRSLFQGSTAQVGYNAECFGLNFEFTQYDIGARKESRVRFSLSLKNLGSFGTLRQQERLF